MRKQSWLAPCYSLQPCLCPPLVSRKSLVFPHRPPDQYTIEVPEGRIHGRFGFLWDILTFIIVCFPVSVSPLHTFRSRRPLYDHRTCMQMLTASPLG
jgi:hypothetical protein